MASVVGSGAAPQEAAVQRRFAAPGPPLPLSLSAMLPPPPPPPPPAADRGVVASAADRLGLLDGPALSFAGGVAWGLAAAPRPGGEHATKPDWD